MNAAVCHIVYSDVFISIMDAEGGNTKNPLATISLERKKYFEARGVALMPHFGYSEEESYLAFSYQVIPYYKKAKDDPNQDFQFWTDGGCDELWDALQKLEAHLSN